MVCANILIMQLVALGTSQLDWMSFQQQQHQNKLEVDLQNSTVDLPTGITTEIQELAPHLNHNHKRIHPTLPATKLLKNIKKQPD